MTVAFFRVRVFSDVDLLPRVLWTLLAGSAASLFVYYTLWTIDPLKGIGDTAYRQLVKETLLAFDSTADLQVGGAKVGPDGDRTIDIAIRGIAQSGIALTLVDVIDAAAPVCIAAIDSIDARRRDLGADAAMVFSNSGFDPVALSKARRINIALLSVLRENDSRVRAVIEQQVFLRRIRLDPVTFRVAWADDASRAALQADPNWANNLTYQRGTISGWLFFKAMQTATFNPFLTGPITRQLDFVTPAPLQLAENTVTVTSLSVTFTPSVQWLSQTARIDAARGIFDYVRGRARIAPGDNRYQVQVDFESATPVPPPDPEQYRPGIGLQEGEIDGAFVLFEGLPDIMGQARLDPLVRPEDLDPRPK